MSELFNIEPKQPEPEQPKFPKKKYKIAKTLCPHKKSEMKYAGPAVDDKTMDVYRCYPCLAWKRFPKEKKQ